MKKVPALSTNTGVKFALLNSQSLSNKSFILSDIITASDLNMLMLTETWLRENESSLLKELCPPN